MRIRAACHVHSEWSYDGSWSLADLARRLGERGCDAVLMSEHDRGFDEDRWNQYREACAKASSQGALLVPGIEYSDPQNSLHLLVWGALPFLGEGRAGADLIAEVRQRGGATVLAHPARRDAWRLLDPGALNQLAGIEVWNRKYDGWSPGTVAAGLAARSDVPGFAGLDFHTDRQFSPLTMALELAGPKSETTIVGAISAGRVRPMLGGLPAMPLVRAPGRILPTAAERIRRVLARARRRPALRRLEARVRRRSPD